MCNQGIFGAQKYNLQTLRRNNTHDTSEIIAFLAISTLRQAIVPVNIFNNFKRAGYSQQWDDNGTCYAQVVHESLAAVSETIEANGLLLKYILAQNKLEIKRLKQTGGSMKTKLTCVAILKECNLQELRFIN
ncbi:MAG: hypothetical protein EZS28_003460 [Streblomastix strix]|uniref:Uncharacterized protein n=1 Tax=Streblomastix strix TaxID=222440 RepID=A0A5J4X1D3_9EUKA|nr:MAG: hypothetical protein EZS28_003460 [Streblomastix strix]